jgi:nicotinate-nucleotide pyrophosphorylase (carboxylating)
MGAAALLPPGGGLDFPRRHDHDGDPMPNPLRPILSFDRLPERPEVRGLIAAALREDIGEGDVTSAALVDPAREANAHLVARSTLVVSGLDLAEVVFRAVEPSVQLQRRAKDGDVVPAGTVVLEARGPAAGLLTAERTALNFMQRLSGVATLTRRFVDAVKPHAAVVLDTRKTIPGWRLLDKYAVLCGGGVNHRQGLFDMVLIKDNHLAHWAAGGGENAWPEAVRAARARFPHLLIEVEADTPAMVRRLLEAGPDWILLDNMSLDELRECVALCRGRCRTEASGGVNLGTVAAIAATGVDAISVGALTHSAPAADLALDFVPG